MTKYDLAKLFSEVDDKYIESARPAAQRAVMVKTARRYPMRIIAAASCAAVLAGGVITVTALRNRGLSAAGNSNASITKESSDVSDMSSNSAVFDEKTGNWFDDKQIYCGGEYYKLMSNEFPGDHLLRFVVGMRINSENKIEVLTYFHNGNSRPIAFRSYGYDSVAEVTLEPKPEKEPIFSSYDNMSEKPFAVTLQPGEECYQISTFDLFYGEFRGEVSFVMENADNGNGFGTGGSRILRGMITEEGIKERDEYLISSPKALTPEEWAQKPLVLPSKFAPKDLDFVNTGNGYGGQNTLIPADKGSEVYAVDGGEVIFANYNTAWNYGWGSVVVIKHGEALYTIYSGLMPVEKGGKAYVSAGDAVKAGQIIGLAEWSGYQFEYGVRYGFYTELPEFFADKLSQDQSEDSSSGSGELDLTTDADGDGIPDKLKELNPDVTDEQWELYKKLEHPEEYGLVQIGEDSFTDGEYGMTTKFFVGPVEE